MNEQPCQPSQSPGKLPTAVITCSVLEIEINHFARELDHIVHVEVLQQGLHNEPPKLRQQVQEAIDRVEAQTKAEAIVLGYGLCSRGVEGVKAKRCKLVIARAHDCITHLLGCKDRYSAYVRERPGTYWYSPGWIKHTSMPGKERYEQTYRAYCEKYGEETAQYLMETEQQWYKHYTHATYVDLGVGVSEKDLSITKEAAEWLGWAFDHQKGDPSLVKALLSGDWDERRFVVLEPGQTLRMTADERVIEAADGK